MLLKSSIFLNKVQEARLYLALSKASFDNQP